MAILTGRVPAVVRGGALWCQVCAPESFSDEQVVEVAEKHNPCGTANGWQIRRAGDPALACDPERQPCEVHKGFVHIMLDA
jgi:hypothetical protein